MNKYNKKVYTSGRFVRDLFFVTSRAFKITNAYRSGRIPWSMSEKIMLASTAVNDCFHCSRFHSTLALISGVDDAEIKAILAMDIEKSVNKYEVVALAFAQHFAETDKNPDEEAIAKLYQFYGKEKADDIMLYLRVILLGNLSGNTYDAFWGRFKGRSVEGSNILSEAFIVSLSAPFIIPIGLYSRLKMWAINRSRGTL